MNTTPDPAPPDYVGPVKAVIGEHGELVAVPCPERRGPAYDVCAGPMFEISRDPMTHSVRCPDCGDPLYAGCVNDPEDVYAEHERCGECRYTPRGLSIAMPVGFHVEAEAWCLAHNARTGHHATHADDYPMVIAHDHRNTLDDQEGTRQ